MDLFMKFGSERDMKDLLHNGTIYCKPISFFAQTDDGCRFDQNELVVKMNYHENSLLHLIPLDNPKQKVTLNASQLRHRISIANPTGNIYCLFLVSIDPKLPEIHSPFDARLKEFGTHCVSIHNNTEFFRRIFEHLRLNNIDFGNDDVTYKDLSKFSGEKNIYTKDLSYAWQKEWRLFLNTGLNEPYIFKIGNLEDIAYMFEAREIEKMVIFSDALVNKNSSQNEQK